MKLKNKKAIVTGASRNIGAAIAIKFAEEGADVLLHYNNDEAGVMAVKDKIGRLGRKAFTLKCDFSNTEHLSAFISKAVELLGGMDLLVNNAGGYDTTSVLELPSEKLESLLSIGVVSPLKMIQQVARVMIKEDKPGAIINISSISGLHPANNRIAHATAKSALNMLTQNAALDLGQYGIRVNAICPGPVPYEGGGDYMTEGIPLGRAGKPGDIANAAAFLASDEASWITGHLMIVDGGLSLSVV